MRTRGSLIAVSRSYFSIFFHSIENIVNVFFVLDTQSLCVILTRFSRCLLHHIV